MKFNKHSDLNYNDNLNKVVIIAEAGVNHNGDINIAKKLIFEAKNAGADAIKFQTFITENVVSKSAKMADYQIKNTGKTETQYDMIKRLELNLNDHRILKQYADEIGIIFLSSPFDIDSVGLLIDLQIPIFKIASGEIVNFDLLRAVARANKPIILSTGMSTLGEIEEALRVIENEGNYDISILQCSSNYPPKFENVNLNAMKTIERAFNYPIGYSDHTIGFEVSIAAVALGAKIIEKHFTLDRNMQGPDHLVSLEPTEFKKMVQSIRNIEVALGTNRKVVSEDEKSTQIAARKSIVAARKINKGSIIEESDLLFKRPGTGILPKYKNFLIGRRTNRDIDLDEVINLEDLV